MRSKEAETYLNRCYKGGRKIKEYNRDMADKAVEIAEEEMKEKAIRAHRFLCPNIKSLEIKIDGTCYLECGLKFPYRPCSNECQFMKEFIDELNG